MSNTPEVPKVLFFGVAVALFVAVLPLPYGYYTLLRFVVTAFSAYLAYVAYEQKQQGIAWASAFLVVLFNPLVPVSFEKEIWIVIDALTATFFLVAAFIVGSSGSKSNEE